MKRIEVQEREDWKEKAKEVGFGFHTMYGEPYWRDDLYYSFTMEQVEKDIEDPTNELHQMCLDTVDRIIDSEEILESLQIPEKVMDAVRESWKNHDKHLYGRFDLAYDGNGPAKMIEYNADTPTSIFEAGYFQHNWMVDQANSGRISKSSDQYNFIQESLVEAFYTIPRDAIFHFSCWTENEEDTGTTAYLMDCAKSAGHETKLVDIKDIGVSAQGEYTDQDDITIARCFKLYPWEDMLREKYSKHLKAGIFIEPLWKSLISNKGFMAYLWKHNQNHPNLLETHIQGEGDLPSDYVKKPFFSREGENVTIVEAGKVLEESEGDYSSGSAIIQERARLFRHEDKHAIIGSWVVGDRACGMGIREDTGLITKDMSNFVPHIIDI